MYYGPVVNSFNELLGVAGESSSLAAFNAPTDPNPYGPVFNCFSDVWNWTSQQVSEIMANPYANTGGTAAAKQAKDKNDEYRAKIKRLNYQTGIDIEKFLSNIGWEGGNLTKFFETISTRNKLAQRMKERIKEENPRVYAYLYTADTLLDIYRTLYNAPSSIAIKPKAGEYTLPYQMLPAAMNIVKNIANKLSENGKKPITREQLIDAIEPLEDLSDPKNILHRQMNPYTRSRIPQNKDGGIAEWNLLMWVKRLAERYVTPDEWDSRGLSLGEQDDVFLNPRNTATTKRVSDEGVNYKLRKFYNLTGMNAEKLVELMGWKGGLVDQFLDLLNSNEVRNHIKTLPTEQQTKLQTLEALRQLVVLLTENTDESKRIHLTTEEKNQFSSMMGSIHKNLTPEVLAEQDETQRKNSLVSAYSDYAETADMRNRQRTITKRMVGSALNHLPSYFFYPQEQSMEAKYKAANRARRKEKTNQRGNNVFGQDTLGNRPTTREFFRRREDERLSDSLGLLRDNADTTDPRIQQLPRAKQRASAAPRQSNKSPGTRAARR